MKEHTHSGITLPLHLHAHLHLRVCMNKLYRHDIGTIPIRSLPKTKDKSATRLSTHGSYP